MDKKLRGTSAIHQPHDKLVKKLLSNPATTRDILSLYLPEDVLAIANLNHLELQRDTFIDDEHRAFAVDLLFKTTFQDEEGYIPIGTNGMARYLASPTPSATPQSTQQYLAQNKPVVYRGSGSATQGTGTSGIKSKLIALHGPE